MESEFSNVKMEIAELRKQIEELEKSKDCKEKEINDFLDDYYDRYTGLYLKSKKFLKSQFLL